MFEFKKSHFNGFNYVFEKHLKAHDEVIVKMPPVSANKRGINDIGWQTTEGAVVALYGTLSNDPEHTTLWQKIDDRDEVNKTVYALKVVNGDKPCDIIIRVILN